MANGIINKNEPNVIHAPSSTIPRQANLATTLTPYIADMAIGFNIVSYGYAGTALCTKIDNSVVSVSFINYYMSANSEKLDYFTQDGGTTWL